MYKYQLSIVIPFYNEEDNVRDVVENLEKEVKKNKINYELILVNNGSDDSTPQIIKDLKKRNPTIKQVNIQKNQGYGWGIINGLNIARGEYIGYVDGDNQIHPKFIIDAYNKLKETNAILCITRRLNRKAGFIRKIASIGYNTIVNILFLTKVKDVNSKPKFIKHKFYKELKLSSKDWFIDTEIVLKAKNNGFKFIEIPVRYNERKKGKSKVRISILKELLFNIIRYRLTSTKSQFEN